MYHANINKMKAGEAILISDRANLTGKKKYQEWRKTLCDYRKEGLIIIKATVPANTKKKK